ncbi:MAG: cysteine desulfurase [Alicyclobacillus sp.]|nr:cysteine desulfurase [Alicyclobacillus sp.]
MPEVQEALTAAFAVYGNPSSLHRKGVEAEQRMEQARAQVLRALGVSGGRLVFTGGGTEANNLAIFGTLHRHGGRGRHVVTTQIEHPSVLECYRALARSGWDVTFVPPEPDGTVRAEKILAAVRPDTVLVSVMHVNNETGALLPVAEVAQGLRGKRTILHVDGIQAFGKIPLAGRVAGADLYTLSGHKVGAPKGVGALYIRPGLEIDPLLYGGGQEHGLRSGTENTLGILALGVAAERVASHAAAHWQQAQALCDELVQGLAALPGCVVQRPAAASPYIVSASFPGLRGEVLVHACEAQGLYVSTGSACSSRGPKAHDSHVLRAMGKPAAEVQGTLRFSLGPQTTHADIEQALQIVREQTAWLNQQLRVRR